MHNAWWWNNAAHCAQTAARQNLCGVRAGPAQRSLLMNGGREECRGQLNTSMSHSIWHLGVTFFEQTCTSSREDLTKWRLAFVSKRTRVRAQSNRLKRATGAEGWVLYFPMTFVWQFAINEQGRNLVSQMESFVFSSFPDHEFKCQIWKFNWYNLSSYHIFLTFSLFSSDLKPQNTYHMFNLNVKLKWNL